MKIKLSIVITLMTTLIALAYYIWGIDAKASEALETAKGHDPYFEQIAKVANNMSNRSVLIKHELILHGIDTVQAMRWSSLPIGPVRDQDGKIYLNIPFLQDSLLPDLGIQIMVIKRDTVISLRRDTLWDFRYKKRD